MNRQFKTLLKFVFSIALTCVFLFFAFRGTDFVELWNILSQANYWWALALIPTLFISHLFRAWRWEYLLHPIKKNLKFRNLFSAMIVGYMMNNVLPRAGELARPYAIGKMEGISRSAAFGTVLMERILDILSFMVVAALIPVIYSGPLTQTFPWLEQAGIWVTTITLGILGLFTFFMMRRDIVMKMLNFITRPFSSRRAKLIEHITHSFLDGFLFLKEPKDFLVIILLSVPVWGFYIIMVYLPFYAFGMTENFSLDLGSALVVQAISSIGFMLPTPGATGSYHYFVIQTLTGLYGVEDELARSYATVTHALGYLSTTVVGVFFFLRAKLHLAEVTKEGTAQEQVTGDLNSAS